MLRTLFLGFLVFALGAGFKNGWLVVKWSKFFNDVGVTHVDPEKPINWSKLMRDGP